MTLKDLSYAKKRKIILTSIAVISFTMMILLSIALIFITYNQSLLSSHTVQLKKAETYAEQVSSTQKNGVVFVGDSIFEMYNLNKHFRGKNYINRGISSNESIDVLNRLQTNVIDLAPKIIILHVGTNDIGHKVTSENYLLNMSKIIDKIKTELPDSYLFIDSIYPTRRLNNFNSMNLTKTRDNIAIKNMNTKLINLCDTKNVQFINTHKLLLENDKLNRSYTIDGLHLSDFGYKVVSREFTKYINEVLEEEAK